MLLATGGSADKTGLEHDEIESGVAREGLTDGPGEIMEEWLIHLWALSDCGSGRLAVRDYTCVYVAPEVAVELGDGSAAVFGRAEDTTGTLPVTLEGLVAAGGCFVNCNCWPLWAEISNTIA